MGQMMSSKVHTCIAIIVLGLHLTSIYGQSQDVYDPRQILELYKQSLLPLQSISMKLDIVQTWPPQEPSHIGRRERSLTFRRDGQRMSWRP